jgi:hypothetical protein
MLPFWPGAYTFPLDHRGYAAPSWAKLHPIELRCTLMSYAIPYWATLHPYELRYTLLSYAAPF